MTNLLNAEALDQLFREARTYNAWLDKAVSDDTLRQLYDLMKWGPTSANACPARFLFVPLTTEQRAITACARAGKRREDYDSARDGDHRV